MAAARRRCAAGVGWPTTLIGAGERHAAAGADVEVQRPRRGSIVFPGGGNAPFDVARAMMSASRRRCPLGPAQRRGSAR